MNIRIVDSHLREFLKTKASASEIAKNLSLTSVSVEKLEKIASDFVYEIEVTTNRADLMSVIGIAREASVILPEFGIDASFMPPKYLKPKVQGNEKIEIENDPKLVKRICAAVLEVKIGESPKFIKERLENAGIRSLNNLVDVTNYLMREIGHPAHVFDFDKLGGKIKITASQGGELIETLDDKKHRLFAGDIIAVNEKGEVVDLLGIMGLKNSVVSDNTKRILLFLDNNDPARIRKTSMNQAIRTEAAVLNEKGVDPNLALDALYRGIELYEKYASGLVISETVDIYEEKPKTNSIKISFEKINKLIGESVPNNSSATILKKLGFEVKETKAGLEVKPPSFRVNDVKIEEDLVEEIARVYGYHRIQSILPPLKAVPPFSLTGDSFYWEDRVKLAMKYWGFTEVLTYSMVSEGLFEGMTEDALKIANPLSVDLLYMRKTLVPSLFSVVKENNSTDNIKIFELSNIYQKRPGSLPLEKLKFAGVVKGKVSFFEIKGLIEAIFEDLGIKNFKFGKREDEMIGADTLIDNQKAGDIEILDDNFIDFELDFEQIVKNASLSKKYSPITKYPPIVEDLSISLNENIATQEVIEEIKNTDGLILDVSLIDQFANKRTFHITYQNPSKNLTNQEVSEIREKIKRNLTDKFQAKF